MLEKSSSVGDKSKWGSFANGKFFVNPWKFQFFEKGSGEDLRVKWIVALAFSQLTKEWNIQFLKELRYRVAGEVTSSEQMWSLSIRDLSRNDNIINWEFDWSRYEKQACCTCGTHLRTSPWILCKHQKLGIWLVKWRKISVLHARHALKNKSVNPLQNNNVKFSWTTSIYRRFLILIPNCGCSWSLPHWHGSTGC